MRHEIKLTKGSDRKTVTFVYDADKICLKYAMPQLDKKSKYKMEVLSYTSSTATAAPEVDDRRNTVLSDEENDVSLRNAQAIDAVRDDDAGVSRLAYEFSTSSYEKFRDKLQKIRNDSIYYLFKDYAENTNFGDVYMYLGNKGETFSDEELYGSVYSLDNPLISLQATLIDAYYNNRIKPLIYDNFTKAGMLPTHRTISVLGFPPAKALYVKSDYKTKNHFPYMYFLERDYRRDYLNLRSQIANKYSNGGLNDYNALMISLFPRIWKGYYEIELFYVFPNGARGSSNKLIFYNNLE
jgi:hypothetical protein